MIFKQYNAKQGNTKQYNTIHYYTISTIQAFAHLYSIVFNQRTEPCIPHMLLQMLNLYIFALIIKHKSCNTLSTLNKLTF